MRRSPEAAARRSAAALSFFAAGLRAAALAGLSCLSAWPAAAGGGTLTVAGGSRRVVAYDCGPEGLRKVTYVNAAADALAILDVDGSKRIFVSVISGSGARYASGRYVWWTKGPEASLYDVTHGPDAGPVAACREGGR